MPVKPEIVRERIGEFSRFDFPNSLWDEIGKIAVTNTRMRILAQKTRDGDRIKTNAQSTLDRKRKKGRPLLSLVDEERRFVKGDSEYNVTVVRNGVEIESKHSRIARYVQKKGYVRWLGLDKSDGWPAVRDLIYDWIKKEASKARRRVKRTKL